MPPGVYTKTPEHLQKLRDAAARRRGPNNPQWRDGRIRCESSPYVYVNVGPDEYQLEHIVIAEGALGRPLPNGSVVHHSNGNGKDNRHSNLVICQDNAYHRLLHARIRVRDAGGDPNTQGICSACRRVCDLVELMVGLLRKSECRECRRASDRRRRLRRKEQTQ